MSSVKAWGEYIWARLRRMDYWNPAHIPTMPTTAMSRPFNPGSGPVPTIKRKADEYVYSVRYFPRDHKRRDTGYYPDTPLSLNHQLMKGKQIRPDNEPPAHAPRVGAFDLGEYATPAAMRVAPAKGEPFP